MTREEAIKELIMGYQPPISVLTKEMVTQFEENCVKACVAYGFDIDAEELKRALAYDRGQYEKGFADARKQFERPSGGWLEYKFSDEFYGHMCACSKCGRRVPEQCVTESYERYNFCPTCGQENVFVPEEEWRKEGCEK